MSAAVHDKQVSQKDRLIGAALYFLEGVLIEHGPNSVQDMLIASRPNSQQEG